MKHTIIIFLLVLSASLSVAQEGFWDKYALSSIRMSDGLQHNFVDAICRDDNGFMWIGTNGGGLSRYDGYEFRIYNVNTPNKLKSNFVRGVCMDGFGRIWVASEGGVDVLDRRREVMVNEHVLPTDSAAAEVFDSAVYDILCDAEGNIWFYAHEHLYSLKFDQRGHVTSMASISHDAHFTAMSLIGGNVWVGSYNRLYIAQAAQYDVTLEHFDYQALAESGAMATTLYAKDNEIWIGTDGGLFRVNTVSGQSRRYVTSSDVHSLSQNRITSICETPSQEIVVATLKGLNIYNAFSDSFERVGEERNAGTHSLSSNFVNCLFADDDQMWIGTEVAGIDVVTSNEYSICNYQNSSLQTSISPAPVNAIVEDRDQNLWVGNVECGLNLKRKNKDTFEHFTAQNHGLTHNSISALAVDNRNHLWIGTWGGGVMEMDLNRANFPVIARYQDLPSPFVGSVIFDPKNDAVWVGTATGVVMIKDGKRLDPVAAEHMQEMNGALGSIIDRKGRLWLGTSALLCIDLESFDGKNVDVEAFTRKLDEPNSKLMPNISFLYEATDGTIYIGTNGYGFYTYTDEHGFRGLTTQHGLISNGVKGISEDGAGNIWVSTDCGMSVYSPQSQKFVNYTTKDGLLCDIYYWNAAYRSAASGKMYFGSVLGLTEIRRRLSGTTQPNTEAPVPMITKLYVNNVEANVGGEYLTEDIATTQQIYMHESEKSFAVIFSALDFRNQARLRYQYRLRGFDSQWVETSGTHRYASFTNLQPGTYTLQVRCAGINGQWGVPRELRITIEPYFFRTFWFGLLLMSALILMIWAAYKYKTRSLREQHRRMHEEVQLRTRELRDQKLILENKTTELEAQNVLLSEQFQEITEQKESILKMSKKIQKLTVDKMQFFTNISHEFRSPITLIAGPVQRALKLTTNDQVRQQLELIDKSSKQLMTLVNQLMDFRKIDSGNYEQHPTSGKFLPFVSDLVHPFSVYASERDVRVNYFTHLDDDLLMFDPDAMTKIITNLLSNALKFSNPGGRVDIYVAAIKQNNRPMLYLAVRDNGVGIPEADIEKIFMRFYQSDNQNMSQTVNSQGGTGIGLYLVRRLVTEVGGRIYARNNRSGGVSMRIMMPLTKGCTSENPDTQIEAEVQAMSAVNDDKLTVLVVEDNADMRAFVASVLSDTYNVLEAKDGMSGLTALAENEVDFIICDLMMPIMNGLEFARKVKSNFSFSHIPILILTAQMSDEYRTESYKIGVESYLHKPFDEQMLVARISGILDGRKNSQQKFQYSLDADDLAIATESDDSKFIRRVLTHVKEHYTDPEYSIEDILKDIGCSKSMLNKKMQNVIGLSPGVFIRSYRLNVAKQLILKNKETRVMNISQIAYEVGFNDPKYFTRCFTKHFCVTPSSLLESGGEVKKTFDQENYEKIIDANMPDLDTK